MSGYNAATALYLAAALIGVVVVFVYQRTLRRILTEGRWRDYYLAMGICVGFFGVVISGGLWSFLRAFAPFSGASAEVWAVTLNMVAVGSSAAAGIFHIRAHGEAMRWRVSVATMLTGGVVIWALTWAIIEIAGLGP